VKSINAKKLLLAAAISAATFVSANASAGILITEVDSSGSGNAAYAADWFELTNTGTSAVNISGWKMDDNSNSFASAVALRGVTSIAAGQSVIFLEGTASGGTDATIDASFLNAWFGSNVPAGLTIGNYGGSGVGLSTSSDAVNLFDASGALQANVSFGAATAGTFNNAAGLNNVALTQKSVIGTNGAFYSLAGSEIGSPGVVAAVPEPETYALMLAGLGLLGFMFRNKKSALGNNSFAV
jgi:hypothetical protein